MAFPLSTGFLAVLSILIDVFVISICTRDSGETRTRAPWRAFTKRLRAFYGIPTGEYVESRSFRWLGPGSFSNRQKPT